MFDQYLVDKWMDDAKEVSLNSYSPYSKFKVGAVVLTHSGNLFYGTNVETSAYDTVHAERAAISAAIAAGHKDDIRAVIIHVDAKSGPPCGFCLQFIIEFGEDIIIIFKYKGEIIQKKVIELLPYKFEL